MFKACGLDSGALRLPSLPVRAVCAPRASRSFAITVRVSHDDHAKSARSPSTLSKSRVPKPPAIEPWEYNALQEPNPSSVQSIERAARLWIEAVSGNEAARDKLKQQRVDQQLSAQREAGYGELDTKIREPQEFHHGLHPALLQNIMRKRPLLRGMPVYDSTFNAVRSGKNLFIEAPIQSRALQYLLPVVHSVFEGIWSRGPPMPDGRPPVTPLEVLIICPILDDVKAVEFMGTRLLRNSGSRLKMAVLGRPKHKGSVENMSQGYNILISTPENLLQWLALGQKKAILLEKLQDLKTIVIDGEARRLSRSDFLETLDGALEDIPRSREVQRVVISDKHNQKLAWHLLKVPQIGDYEFHREPRLEGIQALREGPQGEEKEHKPWWMKRGDVGHVKKKKALNPPLFDTQQEH